MNCERIRDRLFEYADGVLDGDARREVEGHLESCADCAELARAVRSPVDQPEGWTRALVGRLAGDPCERAFDRLPPWVDGELGETDAELVAGHVDHCAECDALAAVLRALREELPRLAEVEPDEAFVGDVLAATVGAARPLSWVARLDGWIAGLMQRPRIAWEGAYVVTAFLLLLVFFPGSPLAGMPAVALDLTRESPNKIEQPFVDLRTSLEVGTHEAWFTTQRAARQFAVRASAESGDAYRYAKRGVGTLWDKFASDPPTDETQDTTQNGESK